MDITNLKPTIEKIIYLESQKKDIADEISYIYSEAKSNGFNTKIIKKLIVAQKDLEKSRLEMAEMKCYAEAVQLNLFD